jgi:RING finger/CHY zinc finger protein 1
MSEIESIQCCEHYDRGCVLLYPCCNEFFPCRVCHDDVKSDMITNPNSIHCCDRQKVITMKCRYCLSIQPIGKQCNECGKTMGTYYCEICKLLDLVDKKQFHCDSCGICRIGGRDETYHCDKCGICVPKNKHLICGQKIEGDCSICYTSLTQNIPKSVTSIKCGHWLHIDCLTEYMKHNYKCPLCAKSINSSNTIDQFIDMQINSTKMPDELKDMMVNIICNECETKSNTNFHYYGMKCCNCGTYNTTQI